MIQTHELTLHRGPVISSKNAYPHQIEPGKRSGRPCIRGLRITVWDVLNWLAAGMTEQQIVDDYPELEYELATTIGPPPVPRFVR